MTREEREIIWERFINAAALIFERVDYSECLALIDSTQDILSLLDALDEADKRAEKCVACGEWSELAAKLTAERDRWKVRAEALERAIMSVHTACCSCKHNHPLVGDYTDGEHNHHNHWNFDEARFTGGVD